MPIPLFPEFRPIELKDKEKISSFFGEVNPVISEFTFTNLFIWRHSYRFQISIHDNTLLILACAENEDHFFMPPVGKNVHPTLFPEILTFMKEKGWNPKIRRVPKDLIDSLDLWDFSGLTIQPCREDFDYVYETKNLVNLSGKKLRKKKNHINSFLKNYTFLFERFSDENVEACFDMQEDWCNLKNCSEDENLGNEEIAVIEALHNRKELGFDGGVILIHGKVEAFSLGEALNKNTAVVHIEKANPKIRGLYATINQLCCKNLWSHFTYINREQDLGEEGLRKAKLSYDPNFLVEKYTIKLR